MAKPKTNESGFGTVGILYLLIIVVVVILGAWLVYAHNHKKPAQVVNQAVKNSDTKSVDPYAGWITGASTRAGFTIKYPSSWNFTESVGTKDNVEHITIDSSSFHITADSYLYGDTKSCADCTKITSSISFTVNQIGTINLNTVQYELDKGVGNALILELPNSTYYIPSPLKANVTTTFRGISNLDTESAYQNETLSQFTSSPEYKTAQKILESLAY